MAQATASPDLAMLKALDARLSAQFTAAWAHGGGAWFGSSATDGAQTAQACALQLGSVVPAGNVSAVTSYLTADIAAHGGAMAVGIIGTKFLTRALTATGNSWLAANITLQTDYPSFGWTFNHPDEPATTLWELWDSPNESVKNIFIPSCSTAFLSISLTLILPASPSPPPTPAQRTW